jgi:hypothetical protein
LKETLRSFCGKKQKSEEKERKLKAKDIGSEISLTEELSSTISELNEEEKLSKAIRHFYDG